MKMLKHLKHVSPLVVAGDKENGGYQIGTSRQRNELTNEGGDSQVAATTCMKAQSEKC